MNHRKLAGIVWNSVTIRKQATGRLRIARRQSHRYYISSNEAKLKTQLSSRFLVTNRVRQRHHNDPVLKIENLRTFTSTASSRDDQESKPQPLPRPAPRKSAAPKETDAFLDRALQKDPDEEWDAIVFSVDKLRYPNRPRDNSQYYTYMELIYDDLHDSRRASQKASDVPWYEILPNIITTETLLKSAIGIWKLEQWMQAEDLLLSWWTPIHSVRSVVLQIALTLRVLQEKEYFEQNDIHLYTGDWLNPTALNRMIATWKHVYVGGQSSALTDCRLKPADLLDTVVNVYYGEYGMKLSEKTFRMIVEAEVSTLLPGQRPDLANIALEKTISLWQSGVECCAPNAKFFNLVAFAWVRADRGQETVDAVSAVRQRMSELNIRYNRISYAHALQALAQRHSKEAAKEAASLLKQMYNEYLEGNQRAQPDPYLFAIAISAWANSGSPEAGSRAEQLYDQMTLLREQNHLLGDNKSDPFVVNSVLRCWGNAKTPSAAAQAEDFWRSTGVPANSVTYGTLARLYSQVGNIKDVERIVKEMEAASASTVDANEKTDGATVQPSLYAYTALLSAYAKQSDLRDKVERAEALIHRMQQKAGTKPNREVYNAFLSVIANSKESSPGTRAEELLLEMKTLGAEDKDVLPDFISYSAVMNVWARAGQAERAAAVLREMFIEFMSGNEDVKPDLQCFNTVLAAYSKSKKENAPQQAENLLQDMKKMADDGSLEIHPDIFTVNSVLACLANSKNKREEAAVRAENLLHDTQRRWKAGDRLMQPSTHSYNSVMNAWARAGKPIRADNIFREMLQDFKNGNEAAKPETSTFNTLIKAWGFSKRPDAMERSEEIVRRMYGYKKSLNLDVAPDVRTYTALILCYGLSKTPGAPQRAEWVVRYMDKLYKDGRLPEGPNKKTFITLRKAWTGSNEPDKEERAAAIQREIEMRFGDGNSEYK